jgi:MYXO-CTERM domain-containing protein
VSSDADCVDAGEGTAADFTGDCNDADATINPASTELPGDGADADCDGTEVCFVDSDGDGATDGTRTVVSSDADCTDPGEGRATADDRDCDDADATVYPGAPEAVDDGVDSDCDGVELCYADADDDGFVDGARTVPSADLDCDDPGEGRAADPGTDCDDTDAAVHPGASEAVGDSVDSDCDGAELCYVDSDGDGFGDGTIAASTDADCDDVGELGTDAPRTDCDDTDRDVHPDATEVCDDADVDEDCDGPADDADPDVDPSTRTTAWTDRDGDGYGDPSAPIEACDPPEDAVAAAADCDDTDPSRAPGAEDIADDGIDQECDGEDASTASGDDGSGSGPGDGGDDKSGCSTASAPSSLFWALPGVLLLGRRRRAASGCPGSSSTPSTGGVQ